MTMGIREILTVLFVSLGLFFATVSVIGTIRQKDFLSYLQIAGVGSGAGILLCCSGLLRRNWKSCRRYPATRTICILPEDFLSF